MSAITTSDELILAAEEWPKETFSENHFFSSYDDIIIRKLGAHGPVLLKGGRGSGKSALLIEASRRLSEACSAIPLYISLRYLPLLRSVGAEYISNFCKITSNVISERLFEQHIEFDFGVASDETTLKGQLASLSAHSGKRVVIFFDDAAHIGREKPLEEFFDLFRTLSTDIISCKASIYPGVTKFGTRFDVYNDATIIDMGRYNTSTAEAYFSGIATKRFPSLMSPRRFSERLSPNQFAALLGRSAVGNVRAFIIMCQKYLDYSKIDLPAINKNLLEMAQEHYWPLLDEVAPKLGKYEPLVEVARDMFDAIIATPIAGRSVVRPTPQPIDRIIVHRKIISEFSKIFEILEYLGFIAKREGSRALKSGGRGPVYAVNLCNSLEGMKTSRLTFEFIDEVLNERREPFEFHAAGDAFSDLGMPQLREENELGIFGRSIDVLRQSQAYPYGLTEDKIGKLQARGLCTVAQLADATDKELDDVPGIGSATVKRIRDVLNQAIWM